MEWLNDSTLILLFATPAAALLGLSMLAKAGFDPTEGDDPLLERAAHAIPPSLLPQPEGRLTEDRDSGSRMETEDGVRRRGRGTFSAREPSGSAHGAFDLEPLAKPDIRGEIDVHARVTIRYATEGDAEARRGARASDWYARHGRGAGKEVTQRRFGREPLDLKDRVGTSGEGREFGRRIGRERAQPYARPQEPRRARASDLDAELENMASSRAAGNDRYERPRRERPRQPPRGNREDLDRDLDDMFAARSAQS
jgi:hypothetical protein